MNIDLNALKVISVEHGIDRDDLLETIARALLWAYRDYRETPPAEGQKARVEIDADTGDVSVLVSEVDDEGAVISEYDDTPVNFSRIGAPTVLDAIKKRVREAEAGRAFTEYSEFEGQVVSGVVQRDANAEARGLIVVELGTEADPQDGILLPAEQIPGEKLKHGDRIKAFVVGVNKGEQKVQVNLSRTHPELVRGLFALEVPEVADGTVEIVAIAREAGHRSKVAVQAKVKGVNAKGACIGPRGARVTNIMQQLGGEKIDIIDYSADPAKYVGNSLAPSKVVRVEVSGAATDADAARGPGGA